MKKHFALLAVLFLVGAGCTGSDPETTQPEQTVPSDCPDVCAAICAGLPEPEVPSGCALPMCACDQPVPVTTNSGQPTSVTVSNPGSESPTTNPEPKTINMKSGNFFFDPSEITAEPGQQVTIKFTENAGFHTIVIDEIDFVKKVEADGTVTFNAPTEPGSYEFYCNIGSHAAMGMKGTLIVN